MRLGRGRSPRPQAVGLVFVKIRVSSVFNPWLNFSWILVAALPLGNSVAKPVSHGLIWGHQLSRSTHRHRSVITSLLQCKSCCTSPPPPSHNRINHARNRKPAKQRTTGKKIHPDRPAEFAPDETLRRNHTPNSIVAVRGRDGSHASDAR